VIFGNHLAFFCPSLSFSHFNFHLKVTSSNQRLGMWEIILLQIKFHTAGANMGLE